MESSGLRLATSEPDCNVVITAFDASTGTHQNCTYVVRGESDRIS